jgi:hypothetical protein
MESMNLRTDPKKKARQAAIDYGIDVNQLDYILSLTPAERLRRHDAALILARAAREAGMRYYGFDNRSPETS